MKTKRASWGTADGVGPEPSIVTDVVEGCREPGCYFGDGGEAHSLSVSAAISAARRHVAKTGHRAGVSITRMHTYASDGTKGIV